ncbi:hypothetical protein C8R43DRAFT_1138466 [Mycena crocata]|nr:hypothetical protein C8R43DRAFT_1138466 [Mycena crocata]
MTLYPRIGTNADILARRADAIVKGVNPINKGFLLRAQKASRRLYSFVFPKELDLLDSVLTQVEQLVLQGVHYEGVQYAYRVDKDKYQLLLRILYDLRKSAEDSFRLSGKTPPALPSWGDDEDLSEAYRPNSFEILAVCFRVEVENFLWLLDKYYDFEERKPQERDIGTISAANDFAADRSPHDPRSISQYNDPVHISKVSGSTSYPIPDAPTVRFGSLPNNGLPRNNRRMSEVFTPMAAIFESAGATSGTYLRTCHMELVAEVRGIVPLLGDRALHLVEIRTTTTVMMTMMTVEILVVAVQFLLAAKEFITPEFWADVGIEAQPQLPLQKLILTSS